MTQKEHIDYTSAMTHSGTGFLMMVNGPADAADTICRSIDLLIFADNSYDKDETTINELIV